MECECSRRQQPPLLPEGAWAQWGKEALYFLSPIMGDGEGWELGVYAINPTDASVFFIVGLPTTGTRPRIAVDDAPCAILGSRVYFATNYDVWFYDICGGGGEWNKYRSLNGSLMCKPYLFTLKDRYLYALGLVVEPRPDFKHKFQVQFKRGWVSLADPPSLCTTQVEIDTISSHGILAISYIGDSKVILHLYSRHYVTCYGSYFYKQHFLCYTLNHGYDGEWSRINLHCNDSVVQTESFRYLCSLPCRSYLLRDIVLLAMPDGKLRAFGLCGLHLEHLDSNLPDLNDKLPPNIKSLLLFQVSKRCYLVIAFSEPANLSVFTFELIYRAPSLSTAADHRCSGTELPLGWLAPPLRMPGCVQPAKSGLELSHPLIRQHDR